MFLNIIKLGEHCFSKMRLFLSVIFLTFTESQRDKIDTKKCKVTHNGIEYEGHLNQTDSKLSCKYWNTDSSLLDSDFVDKNKFSAKNYCRNVKARFENPWCYTTDPDVAEEICDVRLCNSNCRGTGAGNEYGGNVNETYSGRTCLNWSEKVYRKYSNKKQIVTSERVLLDRKFPETSRKRAQNFCRNPTGDAKGPWCLVEDLFEGKVQYDKEYCDVAFCDETNCTFGTNGFYGDDYHTNFFSLRNKTTISLGLQLWNVDMNNYSFRISFNSHPLPLSGENLIKAYNGLEILITNEGFGFVTPVDEDDDGEQHKSEDWYPTSRMLSGVKKRNIDVSWLPEYSLISMKISGFDEIRKQYNNESVENILNQRNGSLVYASVSGNGGLWNLPCDGCEHLVTIAPRCNVHRKMKKDLLFSYIVDFYARSTETIIIELRESPVIMYPFLRIEILGSWNKTTTMYVSSNNSIPEYLSTIGYENIISYWDWSQFHISAMRDHLKLEWVKINVPSETIIDIEHPLVSSAKWYSVCSKSMAHWMFNCFPDELILLPERKPPNCVRSKSAEDYKGNQSITENGQPCFPWVYEGVVKLTENLTFDKVGGKRTQIRNHCINLNSDPLGAYCYVADTQELPTLKMKKEYCNIPLCEASECKMSGIGKEYDGSLNTTRLNRTCLLWEKSNITELPVNDNRTANLTSNYCRNPISNTFGPWCFTTDPHVPIDLCNVPDCVANDACTMITYDFKRTRTFLLKPEWVSSKFFFKVKVWNPTFNRGISIHLIYSEIVQYFSLDIGTNDNGTIELRFHFENGTSVLLKKKCVPNIIPLGYWQGFWLRVPPNSIEFGYEDSQISIFDWIIPLGSDIPYKMAKYFSLFSLGEYNVGFNFPCSYCLISIVESQQENAFYPINLWSETNSFNGELTLHLRATENQTDNMSAVTTIHFYGSDNLTNFIRIVIHAQSIIATTENTSEILAQKGFTVRILRESQWTTFKMLFNQTHFKMTASFQTLLQFNTTKKRVLPFYYFTITAANQNTTWLANCKAPVLDNNPIHGGWSEWSSWTCNAACGGGIGYRRRYCNNPTPNLIGDPCIGPNQEDGECNKFECGCIDPDTIDKAIASLYVNSFNKAVSAGVDVTFPCERNVIKVIQKDSPTSYIQWLKDGYKISKTRRKLEELDINKTDLVLRNVQETDSGVYMCIINPECKPANNLTFVTMKIIALTVIDETEHVVRETTPLELLCRGLALSFIYTELSQSWKLNDELYIDFTTTALEDDEIYIFEEAERIQSGRWHCRIRQRKLNLTWFTNTFRVKVIDPPTIYTYLSEEDAPSVIFYHWNYNLIILFLWIVIILEASAVIYIVYWYWKSRKELLGK